MGFARQNSGASMVGGGIHREMGRSHRRGLRQKKLLSTTLRGWQDFEPDERESFDGNLEVDVSTGGVVALRFVTRWEYRGRRWQSLLRKLRRL